MPVGRECGRVVDALGQPLDGNMIHGVNESWPCGESISHSIDYQKQSTRRWSENYKFITYSRQRSKTWHYRRFSVGKSVLLGMITRFTTI